MAEKIKLGYWKGRGRGQTARLLLSYVGLNWQDVQYAEPNQWFGGQKFNLGLDFPNLPYLIDGDLKISESSAIQRYAIAKSGNQQLLGKDLHDSAKVNELLGILIDIRAAVVPLCFDKDYQAKLKQAWQKIKPKFDLIEKFIGNKDFAFGYLTLADFYIAELSNHFEKLWPEEYKNYAAPQRIRDNFNNLEQVKNYYASQNAIKGPFLPAYAAVKF